MCEAVLCSLRGDVRRSNGADLAQQAQRVPLDLLLDELAVENDVGPRARAIVRGVYVAAPY